LNISTAYKAGDEVFRRDLLKVVYGKPDSTGYPSTVDKWNYSPATKCPLFSKKELTSLIIEGQGAPTEEQLETIQNFVEENLR